MAIGRLRHVGGRIGAPTACAENPRGRGVSLVIIGSRPDSPLAGRTLRVVPFGPPRLVGWRRHPASTVGVLLAAAIAAVPGLRRRRCGAVRRARRRATTGPTRSVPAVDQLRRHVGQRVGGHAHLSASASGDGLGGDGARRLRRALHQPSARPAVHRDHRGLRSAMARSPASPNCQTR